MYEIVIFVICIEITRFILILLSDNYVILCFNYNIIYKEAINY